MEDVLFAFLLLTDKNRLVYAGKSPVPLLDLLCTKSKMSCVNVKPAEQTSIAEPWVFLSQLEMRGGDLNRVLQALISGV